MESFPWWSEEHKKLAAEVEALAEKWMPRAEEAMWKREIPRDLFSEVVESGILRTVIPKEYGGTGLGATGTCIIMEALTCLPGLVFGFVGATMLGGLNQILEFGSEDQKRRFMARILQGENACISITEPSVGTNAAAIEAIARRDGDHYIISGRKRFNTGVGVAERYMLYARTSNDPEKRARYQHLTGFIVEKGMRGFTVEKVVEVMGFDNVQNGFLNLDEVRVPIENRIGEEGEGWRVMTSGLNFERTIIAAQNLSYLRLALKTVVPYAQRRIQFDKPTIDFVNNQFIIADLISNYKIMRMNTYYSAYLSDSGKDPIEGSIAKVFNTETCVESLQNAMRVIGGDGMTRFYPLERLLREAKINQVGGGTREAVKLLIYRMGLKEMANDLNMPHRIIHPELGVPVSMVGKPEKQSQIDENRLLGILAEDYRVNPGLHMTLDDLKDYFEVDDQSLYKVLIALEEKGFVQLYRRKEQIAMAKATNEGLNKAHPKEYYQWYPSWVKKENIF